VAVQTPVQVPCLPIWIIGIAEMSTPFQSRPEFTKVLLANRLLISLNGQIENIGGVAEQAQDWSRAGPQVLVASMLLVYVLRLSCFPLPDAPSPLSRMTLSQIKEFWTPSSNEIPEFLL